MKRNRDSGIIPTSSMADIAFLLLIFFLVTTTIASDIGLPLVLPPERDQDVPVKLHERNVLTILINSADHVLIENVRVKDVNDIDRLIHEFVMNYGVNQELSDNPAEAVVSIRTDRNTSHRQFIAVLDEVHEGYNLIYAERLQISLKEWQKVLNTQQQPESKRLYNLARGLKPDGKMEFPMQISIAEPVNVLPE